MTEHKNFRIYLICLGLFVVPNFIDEIVSLFSNFYQLIFSDIGISSNLLFQELLKTSLISIFIYLLIFKNGGVAKFLTKHGQMENISDQSEKFLNFDGMVKLIGLIYLPIGFLNFMQGFMKFEYSSSYWYFVNFYTFIFMYFGYLLLFKTNIVINFINFKNNTSNPRVNTY